MSNGENDGLRAELAETQQENDRLRAENIDRLMAKGKLEDEIRHLRSSPTVAETDELIERLHTMGDHLRTGAVGQREVWEGWLAETAEALHRLARNQMSTDYANLARVTAIQTQEADTWAKTGKALEQKCWTLEQKCQQFADAILKAMTLIDELLRENVRLCAASSEPPNVRLFTAKNSWEAAMKKLLSDGPSAA